MHTDSSFSQTSISPLTTIYSYILYLYPQEYRERFGEEMVYVLQELVKDEVQQNGKLGMLFLLSVCNDSMQSILHQHVVELRKHGVKKYCQKIFPAGVENYVGGILLLPLFSIFLLDGFFRLLQGDLLQPSQILLQYLYSSPLYWFPVLFTWVVLFPVCAVGMYLYIFARKLRWKKGQLVQREFYMKNGVSLVLCGMGVLFLAMIPLHDVIPCVVKGVLSHGLQQLFRIAVSCRNA